jgi:hypothetical protein
MPGQDMNAAHYGFGETMGEPAGVSELPKQRHADNNEEQQANDRRGENAVKLPSPTSQREQRRDEDRRGDYFAAGRRLLRFRMS